MNKREFIRQSVYLAAGTPLLMMGCENSAESNSAAKEENMDTLKSSSALPYVNNIGLQLYTVRNQMAEDPVATLTALAEIGYQQVELGDTRTAAELVPICRDLGLSVNSSFMQWAVLTNGWDLLPDEPEPFAFGDVLDQAAAADIDHVVFGYLRPEERTSLDDYRRLADVLNQAGQEAKDQGIQLAYHNHNFEFARMDGGIPFEVLIERLDPELVPFELDVFWAALGGYDPKALLTRIKDRTKLLHLKDLKADTPTMTTTDGIPPDTFQELGDGTVAIKELMRLGKEYGVTHCFVEQDQSPAPLKSVDQSLRYLRG